MGSAQLALSAPRLFSACATYPACNLVSSLGPRMGRANGLTRATKKGFAKGFVAGVSSGEGLAGAMKQVEWDTRNQIRESGEPSM